MESTSCLRAMGGWLAACAAATVFVIAFVLFILGAGNVFSVALAGSAVLFPALMVFLIICLMSGIPAAVVIWLGKKFRIRSVWFFAGAGAVIGGLSEIAFFAVVLSGWPGVSPFFALVGLIAGLVYWCVAERR